MFQKSARKLCLPRSGIFVLGGVALSGAVAHAAPLDPVNVWQNGQGLTAQNSALGQGYKNTNSTQGPLNSEAARNIATGINNRDGEIHASVHADMFLDSDEVINPMMAHLADAMGEPSNVGETVQVKNALFDKLTTWGQVSGQLGHTDHGNRARMWTHYAGFSAGVQGQVSDWTMGASINYGRSMINLGMGRDSSGYTNTAAIGTFAGRRWGNFGLKLAASYAFNMLHQERGVYGIQGAAGNLTAGAKQHLHSNYLGGSANAKGEVSYLLHPLRHVKGAFWQNVMLEPFIDAEYVNIQTRGTNERGGDMALHIKHNDQGLAFGAVGFRVGSKFQAAGITWSPHIQANYQHSFGSVSTQAINSFVDADTARKLSMLASGKSKTWKVGGNFVSNDVAYVEAGFGASLTERLSANVSYFGGYGNHNLWSGGTGGIAYAF